MRSTRPARLIVAIFAALAMTVFVNARAAFSDDVEDSGAGADANWERTGPAVDEDADTAGKVLEIPQATCSKDGVSVPCDVDTADPTDDDGQAINAPSPGAPPTLDDDTANAGAPNQDWGTVNDYQNEQIYGVPYAVYPYSVTVASGTMNRPSPLPPSAYAPMSSPLTQAAHPPLNPGPWMTPASMSAFSRPAGSPMTPMTMPGPLLGFHH